jgi:methionyl-tRNA formyltransferase
MGSYEESRLNKLMNEGIVVFADSYVGEKVVSWLVENFSEDKFLIFTTEKNSITEICIKNEIPTEVFVNEDAALKIINKYNYQFKIGFLVWWPKIITSKMFSITEYGFVNTHPSLLPFSRGRNYNFWTIVEESPFGVSIHCVEEGIDNGDIIAQKEIDYCWIDTGGSLFKKARIEMIKLFKDNYVAIRDVNFIRKKQDLSKGSVHYGNELESACEIDLNAQYVAKNLINLFRARTMEGYPGCYFFKDDKKYEIQISIKEVAVN